MRPALDRLGRVGLRWRLAGWVAVVTLLCTGNHVRRGLPGHGDPAAPADRQGDRRRRGELAHNLAPTRAEVPARVSAEAGEHLRDQSFGASSTVLFAVVPGAGRAPTARSCSRGAGQRRDGGEQNQENRLSRKLLTAPTGYSTLLLPDVGDLRLLKRVVRLHGGLRVTVGVGEPLARSRTRRGAWRGRSSSPRSSRSPARCWPRI